MIRAFLTDVDGTLTDGVYQMGEDGTIRKNFYTRDFHGMWMLNEVGIKVGIITYASDEVIVHQCRRGAKYAVLMNGAKDKRQVVEEEFVRRRRIGWEEICYISDDILDVALMNAVGLVACPADSDPAILRLVEARADDGYVCELSGGRGCVREFASYILDLNGETLHVDL